MVPEVTGRVMTGDALTDDQLLYLVGQADAELFRARHGHSSPPLARRRRACGPEDVAFRLTRRHVGWRRAGALACGW